MNFVNFNARIFYFLLFFVPTSLFGQVSIGFINEKLQVKNATDAPVVLEPPLSNYLVKGTNLVIDWANWDQALIISANTDSSFIIFGAKVILPAQANLTLSRKPTDLTVLSFTAPGAKISALPNDDPDYQEQTVERHSFISYQAKYENDLLSIPPVPYTLKYGDQITISTRGLAQDVHIAMDGRAPIMPLGMVKISGYTVSQLTSYLGQLFSERFGNQVFVSATVTASQSHVIEVMGAVMHPDLYELKPNQTSASLTALLDISGKIEATDLDNITWNHNGTITKLSLKTDGKTAISPGDSVFIHQTK